MDKYTIDKGFIGEDLPKNVNTIYVNASYNFAKIISYILRYVCTDRTPIIFGYDGHGLCEYNHPKNGVMNIYGNQWLTDSILFSLFKDTDRLNNRKLFLWTQCCGYDFVERIKDKIVGFHLRGSTGCNELSYGSSVMREFNKLKKLGLSIQEYMDRSTYGYVFSDTTISKNEKILDYLNLKLTPVEKKIIW